MTLLVHVWRAVVHLVTSEMLRTLVSSLVLGHAPERLALMLVLGAVVPEEAPGGEQSLAFLEDALEVEVLVLPSGAQPSETGDDATLVGAVG